MRGYLKKFFLVSFSAVFLTLAGGCTSLPRSQQSVHNASALPEQFLLTPEPDFSSVEFSSRWAGDITERDKIRYLLERVASSDIQFIRNGRAYDGPKARQWLLYKMDHWVRRVETAEDFVTRVASSSQKTGKPYLVKLPEGKVYSLKSVLQRELAAFESYRAAFNAHPQGVVPPRPNQVSVSSVLATRTSQ